jgi:uncharacterized protein YuzE
MKIKYFPDTDTALIVFAERDVAKTREINENIYIDLDERGFLVSMTIEHAKEFTSMKDISYEEVSADG